MNPQPTFRRETLLWVLLLIAIIIIMILFFLNCRHHRMAAIHPKPDQILIWKKPGVSTGEFNTWLNSFKDSIKTLGDITQSEYCANCDGDLLLLSGPGPQLFIQTTLTTGSGGSNSGGGPTGNGGPAYYCANFNMAFGDTTIPEYKQQNRDSITNFPFANPAGPGPATTVAVFDTGLEPGLGSLTQNTQSTCLPDTNSRRGWNFVANNADTRDDYPGLHGTKVTKFIVDEVQYYNKGKVNILPVKIFDSTGKGNFFHTLCALAYAAHSGAKIINASFGFYYYADTSTGRMAVPLFREYLRHYIAGNGILMIAAAGNQMPGEDSLYRAQIGVPNADPRNLDSNWFYPAAFSQVPNAPDLHHHIITVTTVRSSDYSISPLQNYSGTKVDIGVDCDVSLNPWYLFLDPLPSSLASGSSSHPTVTGSSFATPILTGKICAFYHDLPSTTDKDLIFSYLQTISTIGSLPVLTTGNTPPPLKIVAGKTSIHNK